MQHTCIFTCCESAAADTEPLRPLSILVSTVSGVKLFARYKAADTERRGTAVGGGAISASRLLREWLRDIELDCADMGEILSGAELSKLVLAMLAEVTVSRDTIERTTLRSFLA